MDYYPKKTHSENSGQWGITYHYHYKVINEKDSKVNHLIDYCSTEPP